MEAATSGNGAESALERRAADIMILMRHLSWLCLLSPLLLAQNPAAFKVDATYVKVPVTVVDTRGKVLVDLTREEFQLFDEGKARPIENFVLDPTPIHVALLLDVSGSVREELKEIRRTALRFAESFDQEDRLALITFSDRMEILQDWTNNTARLRKSLKRLERGYRTALYDALLSTVKGPLRRVPGKKVLILLTDGLDNDSISSFSDVVDSLIDSNVTLYIVGRTRLVEPQVQKSDRVDFLNQVLRNVLDEEKDFVEIYFREKEASLSYLAEATGGRAFFPKQLSELKDSYIQLAKELKTQYVLTFLPPTRSTKQFRTIQVLCTKPVGRVYHRTKYSWVRPR